MREYLMLGVLVSPIVCAGLGYALDGSWQGIVLGACSGLLLSGVLRRVVMHGINEEDHPTPRESNETKTKPKG